MNSIRNRLVTALLLWLGVLWVLAGVVIYYSMQRSLVAEFDEDLRTTASGVRFLLRPGGRKDREAVEERAALFFSDESGTYYQAWNSWTGEVLRKSENLGSRNLVRRQRLKREPVYWNFELENGERVRAVANRVGSIVGRTVRERQTQRRRSQMGSDVVVARSRSGLDGKLLRLLWGIVAAGLAGGGIAAGIIFLVLRRGLQPLGHLTAEVEMIDAESLASRFETKKLPDELLPVGQKLNDLMMRLEKGFERERRFSADLAHELRTPVAELRSLAEVAIKWPNRAGHSDYGVVLSTSERMQTILENLLALARWETEGATVEKQNVLLEPLIEESWRPYREVAAKKRITMENSIPGSLEVSTNPGMLGLVLTNLFSNAVEYTPEDGLVKVVGHPDGSLRVSNTVEGFDTAEIPYLFERFWRSDSSRSDQRHSGLGLSLSKACAEVLGFGIGAEMEGDDRLVFTLEPLCSTGQSSV